MAEEKGRWITTKNGIHVFIKNGESVEEAMARQFDDDYEFEEWENEGNKHRVDFVRNDMNQSLKQLDSPNKSTMNDSDLEETFYNIVADRLEKHFKNIDGYDKKYEEANKIVENSKVRDFSPEYSQHLKDSYARGKISKQYLIDLYSSQEQIANRLQDNLKEKFGVGKIDSIEVYHYLRDNYDGEVSTDVARIAADIWNNNINKKSQNND